MSRPTLFSPQHFQSSGQNRLSTLRSQVLSLFRPIHPDAHDALSRPRPFHWVRNRLFPRPSGADIELHERPSAVADVPYAKGKRVCPYILLEYSIPPDVIFSLKF
jgi:hypothetical protein